jgi:hypothetical protein
MCISTWNKCRVLNHLENRMWPCKVHCLYSTLVAFEVFLLLSWLFWTLGFYVFNNRSSCLNRIWEAVLTHGLPVPIWTWATSDSPRNWIKTRIPRCRLQRFWLNRIDVGSRICAKKNKQKMSQEMQINACNIISFCFLIDL